MILFEDIKTVYDEVPLSVLAANYSKRQAEAVQQDNEQFNLFLAQLNEELHAIGLWPFRKTMRSEIARNICKCAYNEELVAYFNILLELSEPKTTDCKTLSSLQWQIKQTLNSGYNELSYEKKFQFMFHIIFGTFDLNVQKHFLRLLNKASFNPAKDLLKLMTFIFAYHNGEINFNDLEKNLEILTSVQSVEKISQEELIANTSYGNIPITYASNYLGINDPSVLTLGKCHQAVSKYLKEFPDCYGVYYYIPNYFQGVFDHSVLVDYNEKMVFDLSHNIALPLKYFSKYYNNISFAISGKNFTDLDDMVKKEYGYPLYVSQIEEVKRQLKK